MTRSTRSSLQFLGACLLALLAAVVVASGQPAIAEPHVAAVAPRLANPSIERTPG